MAIINMTEGASGIKVGYNKKVINGLSFRDYTFEDLDVSPLGYSNYHDFFTFYRRGYIYIIYHHSSSSVSDTVYKYDIEARTFTQDTEFSSLASCPSKVTPEQYGRMSVQHFLYDSVADKLYYSRDTSSRKEYEYDFSTKTWTEKTPIDTSLLPINTNGGCCWCMDSSGKIAAWRGNTTSYPVCILENGVWTTVDAPSAFCSDVLFDVNDELYAFSNVASPAVLKVFEEGAWTQYYSQSRNLGSTIGIVAMDTFENHIVIVGVFRDRAHTTEPSSYTIDPHSLVKVYTKSAPDPLSHISLRGAGSLESDELTPSQQIALYVTRGTLEWVGDIGYLCMVHKLSNYSGISFVKVKPIYELIEE